jgi:chemotaxis protein histidine kinase CheA
MMGAQNSKAQIVTTIATNTDPIMPTVAQKKAAAAREKKAAAARAAANRKKRLPTRGNKNKEQDELPKTKKAKTDGTLKQGEYLFSPSLRRKMANASVAEALAAMRKESPEDTVTTSESEEEDDESALGKSSKSIEQWQIEVATLERKVKDMEELLEERDKMIDSLRIQLSADKLKETRRHELCKLPDELTPHRGKLVTTCMSIYGICPILPLGWHPWTENENGFPHRILVGMGLDPHADQARRQWEDHIREFVHDKFRKMTSDRLRKMYIEYERECHEGSVCHSAAESTLTLHLIFTHRRGRDVPQWQGGLVRRRDGEDHR